MSGRRHYRRRSRSPESSSSHRSSMRRDSTTERNDGGGGHRRLKRSSASLSVQRQRSPARHRSRRRRSWVLLNQAGARRDYARRDHITSATAFTSRGDEISVSFELVEPPGTSVVTVDDRSPASTTTTAQWKSSARVVAAHRDVVLLEVTSCHKDDAYLRQNAVTDLFVYQSCSRRRRRPPASLLLLPSPGEPMIGKIGIMSCARSDDEDDGEDPPPFVVARLEIEKRCGAGGAGRPGKVNVVLHLFRSWSGQWESFKDLHVHGANGGRDLRWWSTEAVVPYGYGRRRHMMTMLWVDYYRGMVLMDLSSLETTAADTAPPPPPRLRYVPLPVDRPVGDPYDVELGRGWPSASRCVCVTCHGGVRFVSIDTQHWSDYGVGHAKVLTWSHSRFRITTWSLRDDDTWRRDVRLYEEEFWDALDDDGGDLPHVQPRFPVVDVDDPDVVVLRLEKDMYDHREPKWIIEVDLRKKVLLNAVCYSKGSDAGSFRATEETVDSARMRFDLDPIPSELPCYLDGAGGGGGQTTCKKRRQ